MAEVPKAVSALPTPGVHNEPLGPWLPPPPQPPQWNYTAQICPVSGDLKYSVPCVKTCVRPRVLIIASENIVTHTPSQEWKHLLAA